MNEIEIKKVFHKTFNGLPNPLYCHPQKYFKHRGHLCEIATSATSTEMEAVTLKKMRHMDPLAVLNMGFANCGSMLTVLTPEGDRTPYDGPFDDEDGLKALLGKIPELA